MSLSLKPNHATVKAYYETLGQFGQLYIDHEGAVRSAFQGLLAKCGQRATPKLTLVPEYRIARAKKSSVIVDGALLDLYHLPHGYWEAKDEKDDLLKEVQRKLDKGYPSDNTIFQAPERAILYQGGTRIFDENITRPEALVSVVNQFFDYKMPHIEEWQRAVDEFSERVPELSKAVEKLIKEERLKSATFNTAFVDFYALCQQAINPNLSEDAVERMLVQHLLTERIFRKIFNNPDFSKRNVVAAEIEKVITELTRRAFNRDEFLKRLEPFYHAIEVNAENAADFSEKQHFLNTVYERFFQGYSPKEADTHGIVYTPQPIVNFMVRSVEEILQKEFGRSLGDKGVHILDPFVGTGNFIVRIMQEIKTTDLPYKYENELHCNEVMLLPYYIASMNIEHAYYERTGHYSAFPGICLVDTFELAEADQSGFSFMTAENAERVKRQKASPIFVIVGNPPYNMGQVNENDNNRNRKYTALDTRISRTYALDSKATLKNKLSDPYVKAIRWATDRIGTQGVVCFVSNNGFIDNIAFDGMRAHLERDFDALYVINLHGNIRKDSMRDRIPLGERHTVFGLAAMVGISISFMVRNGGKRKGVFYSECDFRSTREEKFNLLAKWNSTAGVPWKAIEPDKNHNWLTWEEKRDFTGFAPIGDNAAKAGSKTSRTFFEIFSLGVVTSRDSWVYSFSAPILLENVKRLVSIYNSEVGRLQAADSKNEKLSDELKWTDRLKDALSNREHINVRASGVRKALYRPFTSKFLYFDHLLNQRRYLQYLIFPNENSEAENLSICVTGPASEKPFLALASNLIPDLHLSSPGCGTQCFPFYTYAEDGTNRRENITDWALEQFRSHYADPSITKWDIFHYVYAVLHHPEYRTRYAANLRRELPRIPFVSTTNSNQCHSEPGKQPGEEPAGLSGAGKKQVPPVGRNDNTLSSAVTKDIGVFRAFVKAGQRLAEIHVHYEKQPEYPLTKTEKAGEKLDYRVERMKLSKDKTTLTYNRFLTLSGIPKETYDYRLGNRSALEWIVDQYQVSTDKRSGITNDPNRADDPTYILRLIGQVVTVSLETVKIVASLPPMGLSSTEASAAAAPLT